MANQTRLKEWATNEVLTAADLNAEFDRMLAGYNSSALDSDNLDMTATYAWSGAHTHTNTLTVGVDATGHDVKFHGDTAGKYFLWDESADTAIVSGAATVSGVATVTNTTGAGTGSGALVVAGGVSVDQRVLADGFGIGNGGTDPYYYLDAFGGSNFMGAPAINEFALTVAGAEAVRVDSSGNVGIGTTVPNSILELGLATENLEFVDAGSTSATEQDWIEVEVGGVQGYLRVYATK